jgi:hypothetical protein
MFDIQRTQRKRSRRTCVMANPKEHPSRPLRRHHPQVLLGPHSQHAVAHVSKLRSTMGVPNRASRFVHIREHKCGLGDRVWINAHYELSIKGAPFYNPISQDLPQHALRLHLISLTGILQNEN